MTEHVFDITLVDGSTVHVALDYPEDAPGTVDVEFHRITKIDRSDWEDKPFETVRLAKGRYPWTGCIDTDNVLEVERYVRSRVHEWLKFETEPYTNAEQVFADFRKHGGMVRDWQGFYAVTAIWGDKVGIAGHNPFGRDFLYMKEHFTWADGAPFGVVVKQKQQQ